MAKGKQTCKILKEIRRQIAEMNNINYVTSECRYQGDCLGTCPKCEAEVRYLEQQLRSRRLAGKAVALAGISAGMIMMSGCNGTTTDRQAETLQGEPAELLDDTSDYEGEIEEREGKVANVPTDTLTSETAESEKPEEKNKFEPICTKLVVGEMPDSEEIQPIERTFPKPIVGYDEFSEWVRSQIQYPESALRDSVQGRVIVTVTVAADGTICDDAKVLRGIRADVDEEALRIAKLLSDIIPATENGQPVDYEYIFPVTFQLPTAE